MSQTNRRYGAIAVLAVLAVLGYVLDVTIYNSISIVFGSIPALIALRLYGLGWAVAIGAIGASVSYFLWGHPYSILTFTAEILIVGLLLRRVSNLAMADTMFWALVGLPMAFFLYTFGVGVSVDSAAFIAIKQAVNGVFNALIAGLILASLPRLLTAYCDKYSQTKLSDILFNAFAVVSISSAALLISVGSQSDYDRTLVRLSTKMSMIGEFILFEKERGATESIDAAAFQVALSRMLASTESAFGNIDYFAVALVAPDGSHMDVAGETRSLTDEGHAEVSNRMLHQWLPTGDMPELLRSQQGRYLLRIAASNVPDVREIVVEFDARPVIAELEADGRRNLLLLVGFTILALLVSRGIVTLVSRPIHALACQSTAAVSSILDHRRPPSFPRSTIIEYDLLGQGLSDMAEQLLHALREKSELNETLEGRVRERTEKLSLLSEVARQTNNGIVITDTEGHVTWVNEAFEELTGYDLREMRGKKPGQMLQTEPASEEIREHMRQCIARRNSFRVELLNTSKDGDQYWIELHVSPMWDADGSNSGFIGVQTDITNRKNTQEALAKSLERLGLAANVAELGVWSYDPVTATSEWNEKNYDLHGLSIDADISTGWLKQVHGGDADTVIGMFKTLFEAPCDDLSLEYRVDHPEKGARILHTTARGVWAEHQLIRVTGITRDVTEDRRIRDDLAKSAKHVESILDNVVDAIIAVDTNGTILSANRATTDIFGYELKDLEGANIGLLMTREHATNHHGYMKSYLNGNEPQLIGRTREFNAVRKNGELFPIELTVSEIEATVDMERFFVGIIRDITERKNVERMQSEFLATVSHELRTPLTSVNGTLSLIDGGVVGRLDDNGQRLVKAALGNTKILEQLINDLLDLEKLQQGKMEIDLAPECLPTLIEDSVRLSDAYARKFGVSIRIEGDIPRTKVNVDASRVVQILTNYLSNAVKYSESGDVVVVKATLGETHARINVIDQGPGIPKDKQDILFQKFAQADTSDTRKKRGTGLGLAIVRELATRMDGRVGLVSEEGQGSEFWVEFALAGPHQGAEKRSRHHENEQVEGNPEA